MVLLGYSLPHSLRRFELIVPFVLVLVLLLVAFLTIRAFPPGVTLFTASITTSIAGSITVVLPFLSLFPFFLGDDDDAC